MYYNSGGCQLSPFVILILLKSYNVLHRLIPLLRGTFKSQDYNSPSLKD